MIPIVSAEGKFLVPTKSRDLEVFGHDVALNDARGEVPVQKVLMFNALGEQMYS